MYDNLARYYDPAIGRANSIDPLCEKYYSISPYAWCGNNFVNIIDPSGMDWYEAEDGSAIMWKEGSEEIEGYKRIGSTYTVDWGSGVSITYEQQEAVSMEETVLKEGDWETQMPDKAGCYKACVKMLQNKAVETTGRGFEVLVTGTAANGRAGEANANASLGFDIINETLEFDIIDGDIKSGKPIIVGVDYKNGSSNVDGMTDHFIVISGKTETLNKGKVTSTSCRYFDPRTFQKTWGTSKDNQLKVINNRMVGTYNYDIKGPLTYIVTTIRRNK